MGQKQKASHVPVGHSGSLDPYYLSSAWPCLTALCPSDCSTPRRNPSRPQEQSVALCSEESPPPLPSADNQWLHWPLQRAAGSLTERELNGLFSWFCVGKTTQDVGQNKQTKALAGGFGPLRGMGGGSPETEQVSWAR